MVMKKHDYLPLRMSISSAGEGGVGKRRIAFPLDRSWRCLREVLISSMASRGSFIPTKHWPSASIRTTFISMSLVVRPALPICTQRRTVSCIVCHSGTREPERICTLRIRSPLQADEANAKVMTKKAFFPLGHPEHLKDTTADVEMQMHGWQLERK